MGLAATILGVCGNVSAAVLFFSSVPTFYGIWKKKSTELIPWVPYVTTLLNCSLWILYGLPHNKDVTLIMTINGLGLVLNTFYILLLLIFSKDTKKRLKIVASTAMVVLALVAVGLPLNLLVHSKSSRVLVFGVLCVVLNVAMNWSPLSAMYDVVRTKTAESMPFYLCLMIFVNSCFWTGYGILKHDVYVLIPNVLGIFAGLIELFLHYWYYKPGTLLPVCWKKARSSTVEKVDVAVENIELPTTRNGMLHDVPLH